VVCLSSRAHRRSDIDFDDLNYRHRPYGPWQAYGQSKTANALFAVALTGWYQADGVTANAVMPGAISTGLQSHLSGDELRRLGWTEQGGTLVPGPGWVSAEQGAARRRPGLSPASGQSRHRRLPRRVTRFGRVLRRPISPEHERQSLWPPGSSLAARPASGERLPRQPWTAAKPSL